MKYAYYFSMNHVAHYSIPGNTDKIKDCRPDDKIRHDSMNHTIRTRDKNLLILSKLYHEVEISKNKVRTNKSTNNTLLIGHNDNELTQNK